ncbi:scm-like with four MBT domains protein 2 [Grus japonensis]|uniref:Scm-like with four MBT domains protein 2 n=1 Tax=Grus japonensis TaxID=30415 RepID=A0ABC9VPZ9_GRUJA
METNPGPYFGALQEPDIHQGYSGQDFDWADYQKQCGAEAAPHLCFRNVSLQMPSPEYIVDVESMDIFPVGWCEANAYNLTPPHKAVCTINGRYCCPQLYINHRCFSGPYLNKGRIAELPQSVGPGKCVLVLKEVLSMVINAAYKPGSVLRELQLVEDPQWNFQEETLKAKYRGKTYRATVKIVRTSDQESEDDEPDAMEDETGSEETSSELRDDQTDTSSAEVPSTRPRRAVTLRSSTESDRPPPTERTRRSRRPQTHSYGEAEKCMQVKEEIKQEEEEKLILDSNPLEWTVTDVVRFIKLTDCAPLAKIFQEQDIDGQALLLLTLPTVQECMELKLGPAIKLCHQIERVKVAFYAQYAN